MLLQPEERILWLCVMPNLKIQCRLSQGTALANFRDHLMGMNGVAYMYRNVGSMTIYTDDMVPMINHDETSKTLKPISIDHFSGTDRSDVAAYWSPNVNPFVKG